MYDFIPVAIVREYRAKGSNPPRGLLHVGHPQLIKVQVGQVVDHWELDRVIMTVNITT